LLFNEGFLIESRFWAGNPFNEGLFKQDNIKSSDSSNVQQMTNEAKNQCWKPMSYSRSV